MVRTSLFLLLLNASACCGFGFKGCSQNYPNTNIMWCFNRNIANLSDVLSMMPDNVTEINLSKNKIRSIKSGSFSHLLQLKDLDLSQNQLVALRGGEFRGLNLLDCLNLTLNNISHIDPKAFDGLTKLRSLILVHNHIVQILPGVFNFLPEIQVLDLSLNRIQTFNCAECGGSSTLRYLDLLANNIRRLNVSEFPALQYVRLSNNSELELSKHTFVGNPRLKSLLLHGLKAEVLVGLSAETKRNLSWVSYSLFVEKSSFTICGLLKGMEKLQRVEVDLKGSKLPQSNSSLLDCATPYTVIMENANLGNVAQLTGGERKTAKLYLNNCGIKEVSRSTFGGYERLEVLLMNQNNVFIPQDTFQGLSRLTFLSFDRCKIRDIDPRWFDPLENLTRLSLMKNEITALPRNAFSALVHLEQLYLQFNLLKYITQQPFSKLRKLAKLDLSLNIIDFIEGGSFRDLTKLRYLDLSGNRIRRLTQTILSGLTNLKGFVLYNNRLHFRPDEAPFLNLTSLEFIELNYQGPGGQGIGYIGPHLFEGQRRLVHLSIGHAMGDFHPDAFHRLANLKSLYIAGMVLSKTNLTALFSPLRALEKLTLYRTDLDALPSHLLPPENSLEVLKVQSNHLRTVDWTKLEVLPRLHVLDITDNPLTCTCDNAWLKTWAIGDPHIQVSYLYDLHCDNNHRSAFLWQFDDKACSYEQISLTLFIGSSVVDVLLVCVCLAWHTQGASLRYLLLILRAKLRGRRRTAKANVQYDAFVSYSSRDEAWVLEQLVPCLERPAAGAPRLRLCLHHRDFLPGNPILENIESAIYSSRHTLCVVTRHFLQSEWCSMEFQLASLRLLCDGSDVLLLLFLEEIPEHCLSPYTRLRKIVRRKTYLLWPADAKEQEAFWVRLRDALKGNEEEDEGGRADDLTPLIG